MGACFYQDIDCLGRRAGENIRSTEAHDNDHRPTTLGADPEMGNTLGGAPVFDGRGLRSRTEQLETKWQQSRPPPIGKEAEASDADETLGKQVEQETPQELIYRKCHRLLVVAVRAVSPEECDVSVDKRDQAMVGNGHSMGIAAEIAENIFRAAKWGSAVNDPLMAEQLTDKGVELLRV